MIIRLGSRVPSTSTNNPVDQAMWNANRLQGIDVVVSGMVSGDILFYDGADFVDGKHNDIGGLTVGDPHTQYPLLVGRSGGQTLYGGIAAGNGLTIKSTSHGTRGQVFLGELCVVDDAPAAGQPVGLGVGTTAPEGTISAYRDGAQAVFQCRSYAASGLGALFAMERTLGSQSSPSGLTVDVVIGGLDFRGHDTSLVVGDGRAQFRAIADGTWSTTSTPTRMDFLTCPALSVTPVQRLLLTSTGSTVLGNGALGTTATDGFLYIPTCSGPPTGVPTAYTGRVPLVYDITNKRLYVYNGAWESALFA